MRIFFIPSPLRSSFQRASFCNSAIHGEGRVSMVQGASRGIGLEFVSSFLNTDMLSNSIMFGFLVSWSVSFELLKRVVWLVHCNLVLFIYLVCFQGFMEFNNDFLSLSFFKHFFLNFLCLFGHMNGRMISLRNSSASWCWLHGSWFGFFLFLWYPTFPLARIVFYMHLQNAFGVHAWNVFEFGIWVRRALGSSLDKIRWRMVCVCVCVCFLFSS